MKGTMDSLPDEMIEYIINIMMTEGNFNIAVLLFELTCSRFRNLKRGKLTIVEESAKEKLSKLSYVPFFIKEAQSVYKNRKLFQTFFYRLCAMEGRAPCKKCTKCFPQQFRCYVCGGCPSCDMCQVCFGSCNLCLHGFESDNQNVTICGYCK